MVASEKVDKLKKDMGKAIKCLKKFDGDLESDEYDECVNHFVVLGEGLLDILSKSLETPEIKTLRQQLRIFSKVFELKCEAFVLKQAKQHFGGGLSSLL